RSPGYEDCHFDGSTTKLDALIRAAPGREAKMSFRELIAAATNSLWTKAASAICLLFIIVYSLIPQSERVNTGFPGSIEHVLAYSLTGLLLGLAIRSKRAPLLAATHLTWLGCLLEFL